MEIIKNYLNENEDVIETIYPVYNKIFAINDIFLIPFSLLWGGFAIFWEISTILYHAPIMFPIFGIPFVVIGLYFIFGRFIYKKWKNKNTVYVITNNRLIILTKNILGQCKFASKFINAIETLEIEGNPMGIGSVIFQHYAHPFYKMYQNSGFDFFISDFTGFHNICNPKQVYDKIMEIKSA